MSYLKSLLVVLLMISASGALMGGACDDGLCGPCGEIQNGDTTISGDARLDGFFKALGTVKMRTASIRTDFETRARALAEVFMDVEPDATIDAAYVQSLKDAIDAEIKAYAQGALTVDYQPPKCSADLSVAVEAQANCEAKAGCSGGCDPGKIEVECEGSCSGGCSGSCSGEARCAVEVSVEGKCEATCEGSCQLTGPKLDCDGTCSGTCVVGGNETQVSGKCEGECDGVCEYTPANGSCEGTCKGECMAKAEANVECKGEVRCEGSCSGECSGGCEGNVTPPSCDVDCEASAKCQASAKAQASAELKCDPPSLRVGYAFKGGISAQEKAEFLAKMEIFRTEMVGILKGFEELQALAKKKAGATVDPPLVLLTQELQGLGESALTGEFDVSAGLITCTLDAIKEIPKIAKAIETDVTFTFSSATTLTSIVL